MNQPTPPYPPQQPGQPTPSSYPSQQPGQPTPPSYPPQQPGQPTPPPYPPQQPGQPTLYSYPPQQLNQQAPYPSQKSGQSMLYPPQQPNYQAPYQSRQLPGQKTTQKVNPLTVIGTILSIIGLLFYFVGHQTTPSTADTTSQESAKIGDTIVLDSISCILKEANVVSGTNDIGFTISVHIKLTNQSQGEFHYYTSDFQIKTDKGAIISADFLSEFSSGALAPNGQAEGILFFSGIDNPQKAELLWQPAGHSDELSHNWKLDQIKKNTNS